MYIWYEMDIPVWVSNFKEEKGPFLKGFLARHADTPGADQSIAPVVRWARIAHRYLKIQQRQADGPPGGHRTYGAATLADSQ